MLIYSAAPVHLPIGWIVGNSPGSLVHNIYLFGSDKLAEVQLYMPASCQPSSRVIRAFSDVEKPVFFISDLAVKASILENKKDFLTSE